MKHYAHYKLFLTLIVISMLFADAGVVSVTATLHCTLRPLSLADSYGLHNLLNAMPDAEELFIATDEDGNFLKDSNGEYVVYPRSYCHQEGIWHRTVGIIVINSRGQMLVQRRGSDKKIKPNALDISAGGHTGTDTDMKTAAKRELWEELFDESPDVEIDPERLIRITPEGTFIKNNSTGQYRERENATFFVYFLSEEDERLISPQKSEVQNVFFDDFETVVGDYLNSHNADNYAAGFLFFGEYDTSKNIPGTPQNLLHLLVNNRFSYSERYEISDFIVIMDKDGTVSKVNEEVDIVMLDAIVEVLKLGARIVMCTGGMLMHSMDNFIKPLESRLEREGLWSSISELTYFFMSGTGKISWDKMGNRTVTYLEGGFTSDDQTAIFRNLAIAFIRQASAEIKGLNEIRSSLNRIKESKDIEQAAMVFNDFIVSNKDYIGHIEINNGIGKQFTLELKASSLMQAVPQLQDISFSGKVSDLFKQLIAERDGLANAVIHYGDTYVDINIIDKEITVQKFLEEGNYRNPLVIAIGDGRNDFGFLGTDIGKGRKLPFFVGRDYRDMPENVIVWAKQGPLGTKEILNFTASLVRSETINFNYVPYKTLFFHRRVMNVLQSSA